jgi:hypothetical protein
VVVGLVSLIEVPDGGVSVGTVLETLGIPLHTAHFVEGLVHGLSSSVCLSRTFVFLCQVRASTDGTYRVCIAPVFWMAKLLEFKTLCLLSKWNV